MRKIKSVKLNKEFNNGKYSKPIGTPLEYQQFYDLYKLHFFQNDCCYYRIEDINKNSAGLFDIEYEPEGFEFSHFPFYVNDIYNKQQIESELNRLADWCDGQSEDNRNHKYSVAMQGNKFAYYSHSTYSHQGLKFCSEKSAELFITELNKPENSDYKNYFINLLKKTRL